MPKIHKVSIREIEDHFTAAATPCDGLCAQHHVVIHLNGWRSRSVGTLRTEDALALADEIYQVARNQGVAQ